MRRTKTNLSRAMVLASITLTASPSHATTKIQPRAVFSADSDWRFALGDPKGAEKPDFSDRAWHTVSIPHDWSIESAPIETNSTGPGEGYYPEGIGWYRKSFTAPGSWKGRHISLEFDGVSSNAEVYLNGVKLGFHPYAYTGFRYDITSQFKPSGKNVLAVRVDNSKQPNSRWYSGSGIYRHVHLVVTQPVHVAPWGVFISTPEVSPTTGSVHFLTAIENSSSAAQEVLIETVVTGPTGARLPAVRQTVSIEAEGSIASEQNMELQHPALWSPQSPSLYKATIRLLHKGKLIDQVNTSFGIRSIVWSVGKGLLLNGTPIKLAGGSVHHDNGPLGAAAFDRAEERKVELLKAAGFNAVRTAHNPPSVAFLDACDRLGLLVVDEPFDVWTVSKRTYDYAQFFKDWWRKDVDAMVLRDRNHPSVLIWGIGNEIPEVWTSEGAPLAEEMSSRVRSLDSTRPLTQAFPGATFGPNPDAAIAKVDIAGYNYNLAQNGSADHTRVPGRVMMTTESFPADAFEQWSLTQDHPYVLGEFVWTAMDYLGESGIGAWTYGTTKQAAQAGQMQGFMRDYLAKMGADGNNPMAPFQNGQPPSPVTPGFPWHGSYCGDLDLTGFRKPWSHYRDILWNGGDRIYATVRLPEVDGRAILAPGWSVYPSLPSWTWPGQEGKPLTVEVYSGAERVRLYLNGKLIGEKPTGREQEFKAQFAVPYEAGTLKAVGISSGKDVTENVIETTGLPTRLRLTADRTSLSADQQDLAFVTIEAIDRNGHVIMGGDQRINLAVKGAATIAAVGSGDMQSTDSYAAQTVKLFNGRAIVILKTTMEAGQITLSANGDQLSASPLILKSSIVSRLPQLR